MCVFVLGVLSMTGFNVALWASSSRGQRAPVTELTIHYGGDLAGSGSSSTPTPIVPPIVPPIIAPLVVEPDFDDPELSNYTFAEALALYTKNLHMTITRGNVDQPTDQYTDIMEIPGHGVRLPHDPSQVTPTEQWQACDPTDAEFTLERDALCQKYLSNLNNMLSIKALAAILKKGRTIKFKIFYRHNNLQAIVKVSQNKFLYEPASEYLAFAVDRELNITRTPPTSYTAIPLDYMRAACAIVGPFYSQWFQRFVVTYEYTKHNFVKCPKVADPGVLANIGQEGLDRMNNVKDCPLTALQIWMKDVHSALYSNLALNYDSDEYFFKKFYSLEGKPRWPHKPLKMRALGDMNVRFVFDFIVGNTDRGMNDHNNFVYGGCDAHTRCRPKGKNESTKGISKYAFIDHGSSFYSHKEPPESPFSVNVTDNRMCRFRRSMYERFKTLSGTAREDKIHPLVMNIRQKLPKNIFNLIRTGVFLKSQDRLDKIVLMVERCLQLYPEKDVFSLPEYWET